VLSCIRNWHDPNLELSRALGSQWARRSLSLSGRYQHAIHNLFRSVMPKSALGPNRTSRIDTPCPFSQCDAKERSRLYMLEPTLLSFFSSRAQPELVTNFLVRKCPVTRFSCRNRRGRILEAKDLAISFVCYVLCCRASAGVSFLENPHILGPELSNLILGLCSIIFIAIGMLLIFCHKKNSGVVRTCTR
jgi:hypothetical protein